MNLYHSVIIKIIYVYYCINNILKIEKKLYFLNQAKKTKLNTISRLLIFSRFAVLKVYRSRHTFEHMSFFLYRVLRLQHRNCYLITHFNVLTAFQSIHVTFSRIFSLSFSIDKEHEKELTEKCSSSLFTIN